MYTHPAHAAPRSPILVRSGVTASAVALVLAGFAAPAAAHTPAEETTPPVAEEDGPVAAANEAGDEGVTESGDPEADEPVLYEVASGDYLSSIARENGLDPVEGWRHLFDANPDVENPDVIVPGQVLRIPEPDEQLESRPLPAAPAPAPAPEAPPAAEQSTSGETAAPQQSTPQPASAPATEPQVNTSAPAGVWQQLAQCESGGNWQANTGNGYFGGLQFTLSSWRWVGGTGYPHHASRGEQIRRAERLLERQGWSAWPSCSRKVGLR